MLIEVPLSLSSLITHLSLKLWLHSKMKLNSTSSSSTVQVGSSIIYWRLSRNFQKNSTWLVDLGPNFMLRKLYLLLSTCMKKILSIVTLNLKISWLIARGTSNLLILGCLRKSREDRKMCFLFLVCLSTQHLRYFSRRNVIKLSIFGV